MDIRSSKTTLWSQWLGWLDRHAVKVAIGACVVLIVLASFTIRALAGFDNTPKWWTLADTIRSGDPAIIERAEQLENAITTQLTVMRDLDDPQWSAAINPEQANAWLEVRLIETIVTHQGEDAWPSEIERIRIGIEDDQLIIGARVVHASGSSIVWAKVQLELDDAGDLWTRLFSVRIGTTRVPRWLIQSMGNEQVVESKFRIGPGTLEIGDGRAAQLIALRINGGRLEVVMETRVHE